MYMRRKRYEYKEGKGWILKGKGIEIGRARD
jgi:hypothetical protein